MISSVKQFGFIILITLFLSVSCKSKRISVKNNHSVIELKQDLSAEGYVKAIIVHQDSVNNYCTYLFQLQGGTFLEPMVFPDSLKLRNASIWLKYQNQRRPSRCKIAQPIEIIDVKR